MLSEQESDGDSHENLTVYRLGSEVSFAVRNSKVADISVHKVLPDPVDNQSEKFYWFLKTKAHLVSLVSSPFAGEALEVKRYMVEKKCFEGGEDSAVQQKAIHSYYLAHWPRRKVKMKRKKKISKDVIHIKEMPVFTNWPPKRQDKLSSLTSGTSKLVRRLGGYTTKKQPIKSLSGNDVTKDVQRTPHQPLRISPNLELGSEVQLEYNGVAVTGVIRYIGTTDFSPGKWCGIELTENVGKHNGTVNGKCYFVCRDAYGVFIRFNKVADKISPRPATAPPGHTPGYTLKEPADMRITVKSVKTKPTSLPINGETYICDPADSKPNGVITNGNIKSSVKSYIKSKKDKKLSTKELLNEIRKEKENGHKSVAKNVVVSSFTAPAPVAPVVVSPQSDDMSTTPLSSENEIDEVFLLNNLSPSDETSSSLDETVTGEESSDVADNASEKLPTPQTPSTENDTDAIFSESDSLRTDAEADIPLDLSTSRIPRRIGSMRKTSNPNKDVCPTSERPKPNSCSEFTGNIRKFSKGRNCSENETSSIPTRSLLVECEKTPAPFPKTFRSSKRALEFNKNVANIEQNEQTENQKNIINTTSKLNEPPEKYKNSLVKPVAVPEPHIARPRSTPSLPRKSVVTSSIAVARRTPTPVMPRKNEGSLHSKLAPPRSVIKEDVKEESTTDDDGGKNADSATVMGNASVINASCYKKNSDCDATDVNITLPEMVEATVIQNEILKKTKEGKTKKTLVKTNSNRSFKDNTKELQKEVDNLQNQLKERTDRITELELTIKNNNNNNLEERSEFERKSSELESQLKGKNLNILEVEGKYTAAQLLVTKSNKGFEALGIVIQYYLQQIEHVSKQLTEALEEKEQLYSKNGQLSEENESVKAELHEIMKKLDAEKSRCETVQHDLETLATNHEAEINALTERHQQEQEKLKSSLTDEKQEGIEKVKEEYLAEIERLKSEHQKEIVNLTTQHQNQIQEVLQEKGNSINDLVTKHDIALRAKDTKHTQAVEDLNNVHEIKVDELNDRLTCTVNERDKVQTRIEEIVKELENDNKVQQALVPYKHLPEELQSLQVVLDLRNEEIKTNRLKNMELQKKVDEYYELKTKFDSLSQENASLKESLKKRTLSERKLSVERDTLLEKFENEIKKVNLLSMEKEQLMWRASNPDLSTSLPNVFEDVEDEGCSMSPLRSSGSFSTSPPITFAPAKLKRRMQPKLLRRVNTMSFYKTFNKVERK